MRPPAAGFVGERRKWSGAAAARPRLELREELDAEGAGLGGGGFGYVPVQVDAAPLLAAAQEALKAGQTARQQGQLDAARTALLRAYFLASAALAGNAEAGPLADQAMSDLEAVHAQQLAAWTKDNPVLDKRLDLVLRDRSIAEALEAVAAAAGVAIKLIPGSVEDAAGLLGTQTPRVTYLDLRGATVAQALDWILQPAKLSWQLSKGAVVAGSDRRRGTESAWVYDVSLIALPSAEELTAAKDEPQQIEAVKKAATEFLTAVRRELGLAGETTATWFAPGQLLVIGNAEKHAAAQALFDELAAPPTAETKRLAELRAVTSRRAAQNRPAAEKAAGCAAAA